MNLWNQRNLEAPPTSTYKLNTHIDLHRLTEAFRIAVVYFQNQKLLNTEAALLSRCIYRMKMKFRADKGLKSMEKLNRVLLQYLRLDFAGVVTNFYELLPQERASETFVPTRNMLDFILVRLQGLAMLMSRAVETAQISAHLMENKISIGHFWKVAFIAFSLVSRIWLICKNVTRFCCRLFSEILPLRQLLENVGNQWLPSAYIFPDDLAVWLNIDWLNENDKVIDVERKTMDVNIFKSDSDIEICDEYTEIDDDLEIVNEYVQIILNDDEKKVCNELNKFNVMFQANVDKVGEHEIQTEAKTCQKGKHNRIIKRRKQSKVVQNFEINIGDLKEEPETRLVSDERITDSCINDKRQRKINDEPERVNKKRKRGAVFKNVEIDVSRVVKKKRFHVNDIDSPECLRKFIRSEEKRRNVNVQDCVTKNLDKLQWNMLQKLLTSFVKKAEKNEANASKAASYLLKARESLKTSLC